MTSPLITINPELDLVLEREIDVPVELVWKAWTTPDHLRQWFAPKPWEITACAMDLRPGGALTFTMRGPDGQEFPNTMCYLDIVPNQRLIFTDTMQAGFRPSANPFFTATLDLETRGSGTLYRACAIHGNPESRKKHEDMGFHGGWGTVLTQLVEYIKDGRV